LVIELKTEIVDVQELLGTLDRKARLGPQIVEDLGWKPRAVGRWVIVAESSTNRRRVAVHAQTVRAVLPVGHSEIVAWLREPRGPRAASRQSGRFRRHSLDQRGANDNRLGVPAG